ncbi:hypothetical protein [Actinotalea sp.]|uniref:hypothetical protein n=1 Tax=Actinotalea sp. TaxID=1872145 RepID=UPI003565E3A1
MEITCAGHVRFPTRGLAAIAALLLLTACSGSTESAEASGAADDSSSTAEDSGSSETATEETGQEPAEAAAGGPGTGVITMDDGTVYTFEMTTCDTSETVPDEIPLTNGYDLAGTTADGTTDLTLARLGFSPDEVAVTVGSIEGDYDENRQNAELLYAANVEELDLTVSGGSVTGTATMRAVGPNRPHGDQPTATVDVSC